MTCDPTLGSTALCTLLTLGEGSLYPEPSVEQVATLLQHLRSRAAQVHQLWVGRELVSQSDLAMLPLRPKGSCKSIPCPLWDTDALRMSGRLCRGLCNASHPYPRPNLKCQSFPKSKNTLSRAGESRTCPLIKKELKWATHYLGSGWHGIL